MNEQEDTAAHTIAANTIFFMHRAPNVVFVRMYTSGGTMAEVPQVTSAAIL